MAKLVCRSMQSKTNASNSRLTACRTFLGMPTYEPPFSSAARSSALKQETPKLDTGKIEDLPLPGGPATTIILGDISLMPLIKSRIHIRLLVAPCRLGAPPVAPDLLAARVSTGVVVESIDPASVTSGCEDVLIDPGGELDADRIAIRRVRTTLKKAWAAPINGLSERRRK
jgi:hypothetical protein